MASSEAAAVSVQELAKDREGMLTVPQRYIQENREPTYNNYTYTTTTNINHSINFSPTNTIPLVDIKLLLEGRSKHDVELLDNFHSICKEWGIFQVVNHGVNSSVVEKLRYEIKEFYKLPLQEKMRFQLKPGEVEGYGQTILHSQDPKVDWADRFYIITNPIHKRKSHLLPELPSSLRNTLESYFVELQKLAMTLFEVMEEALKMEKREIEEMFENGMQSIRMNYYPPCPQPEQVVGLSPHSDATGITILQQVNGVDGLEVKKDGLWIPVKFLPDSFVVNVGDILEIVSNGVYNSIEHRATVNSEKERITIAMFFVPNFEAYVGPSPSLVSEENPPLFKRIPMQKYVKDFFSRKLVGKSFLEHMKIKN